jgi:hypothetical protein
MNNDISISSIKAEFASREYLRYIDNKDVNQIDTKGVESDESSDVDDSEEDLLFENW